MKVHEGKLVLPTIRLLTGVGNAGGLIIISHLHGFMFDSNAKKLIYHFALVKDDRFTFGLSAAERNCLRGIRRLDESLLKYPTFTSVYTKDLGNLQPPDEAVKEIALEKLKECLGYNEINIPQRYKKQAWERFAQNIRVVSE